MVNPYKAATAVPSAVIRLRAVRPCIVAVPILFSIGLIIAMPGLRLLNQAWELVPTQVQVYDIEINGRPVSNATAICFFIGIGFAFLLAAVALGARGFSNWRYNRRVLRSSTNETALV